MRMPRGRTGEGSKWCHYERQARARREGALNEGEGQMEGPRRPERARSRQLSPVESLKLLTEVDV